MYHSAAFLLAFTPFWFGAATASDEPLGRSLYRSYCFRCHGDDGDATDYYNIVPLAGIGRRPPVGLVGRFREESFTARGIEFSGKRAKSLGRYLFQLRGRKGFHDPGWLWSSFLLNRKSALINECRILDARAPEEYSIQHIPNAVSFPLKRDLGDLLPMRQIQSILQDAGIRHNTQIVVYDDKGGPDAAWLWLSLVQAGHAYVSVLDGGWESWISAGLPVSRATPNVAPSLYHLESATSTKEIRLSGKEIEWKWTTTLGPSGFKTAEAISQLLTKSGLENSGSYTFTGTMGEAAHLILILKLLGKSGRIEAVEKGRILVAISEGD